jgi:hypothetical protein
MKFMKEFRALRHACLSLVLLLTFAPLATWAQQPPAAPPTAGAAQGHSFFGLVVEALSDNLRASLSYKDPGGVLVIKVYAGSPADRAGVHAGDIVISVNGHAVASPADFVAAIVAVPVGSTAAVSLWNDGSQRLATAATVEAPPAAATAPAAAIPAAAGAAPVADLQALPPPSPGDPIQVLKYYTPANRGATEESLGLTFMNVSSKTATIVKFLIEIADPFGKILESDAFEARGTFSPNVKIEPRFAGAEVDSTDATYNANGDGAIGAHNAWLFHNRFGAEFDSWAARVIGVRYADGSLWQTSTRYPIVPRPPPAPSANPGNNNNGCNGLVGFLFC